MTSEGPKSPGSPRSAADSTPQRLDSWKEIAVYLGRSLRAVQRWEKEEGLPVYRHAHSQRDSVWAQREELDAWRARRASGSNGGPRGAASPDVAVATGRADAWLTAESGEAEARTLLRGPASGHPLQGRSRLLLLVALATAVGAAAWRWHSGSGRPEPALVARPLTSDPGLEWGPSLSPDGSEVVFSRATAGPAPSPESACTGLTVLDLASRRTRSVGTGCAGWARWSPDGSRIAFTRYAAPTRQEVVVVPSAGGPEKVLGQIAGRQVAWTADGASLAVGDRESEGQPFALYLLTLETGRMRRLTSPPPEALGETEAAFSPDGQWVAFVRYGGLGHLFVMPAQGGDPRRLTEDEAQFHGLDWTSDSKEVLFSAEDGGRGPHLWRVEVGASGQTPHPLEAVESGARQPSLSRRGSNRLVYQQEGLDVNIWGRAFAPDAAPRVWTGSTWVDRQPAFSPNGQTVAFASNRSGRWEIWLSSASGSHARPVTSSVGEYSAWPRWSSDGRRIAFTCRRDGKAHVFVADADGGRVRRITSDDADEGRPSWSRDGRWIYFAAADAAGLSQVWRAPADAPGERQQITRHGGFEAFEGPGGRALLFTRGRDISGLWSLDLSTGLESPMVSTLCEGYWEVADDGVYYLDIHHADEILLGEPVRVFRFASQRVETVAMVPTEWSQILPGFTVDRAATRFLWNQIDQHTSDLMLIDDFR